MSAAEYRTNVESGKVPVDSHDRVLRIAYIYMDAGLWEDDGVFDVAAQLHARGWSFGQGDLKFNRTLDVFYLTQIAASIYRSCAQLDGDFPLPDDFEAFYAEHRQLLNQNAWKQYYSPTLLTQATSARFYRLPDLQDLPDSSDPLGAPRQKGVGHFTKLPRWAHDVVRAHRRQPALPVPTITEIALSTLQKTISRVRGQCPGVQPYSETQARFWLRYMKLKSSQTVSPKTAWNPHEFGIQVARGLYDTWAWEAHYSPERWASFEAPPLEPDLDGTRPSVVSWCGWPDGGVGGQARSRGWEPEVGSEEEIAFLAAVAVKETEGIELSQLDYSMRSHIFLGMLYAAFEGGSLIEDLTRRVVEAGRLGEGEAEPWIRQALLVMETYVVPEGEQQVWPAAAKDRDELLWRVLVENGQLFARWQRSRTCKEFNFELRPRQRRETDRARTT